MKPRFFNRHANSCPAGFEQLESRTLFAGSGLSAAYFSRTNLTDTKFSQKDSTVNFQWKKGTPSSSLGSDGFSVRWSGMVEPKFSETYTFIATSSGGARVWVNNTLIIDAWGSHKSQQNSGAIKLSGGHRYNIRVDYWSDGKNTPAMKLEWQSSRRTREVIPANRLYNYALEKTKPTTPGHLRVASSANTSVTLAWDASKDATAVVGYDVFVGSSKVGTTTANTRSFTRSGLAPQTGYTFSVQAIDPSGNGSTKAVTAVTTAAGPSVSAPSTPAGLHVLGKTTDTVSIAWNASSDDVQVSGYRIYRNGVKVGSTTGTSFTDQQLNSNSTYSYVVRAVDNAGVFSANSAALVVTTLQSASHNPFSSIAASSYDAASGVDVSGTDLTNLDDGDWVRYDNVNFGGGAKAVKFDLALDTSNRGGSIELHLDSVNGQQVGRYEVQPTGGWDTFFKQQTNISTITGTHNLYVVFKGRSGVANMRSVQFNTQSLVRIMPLGDSITQQSASTPSYRYYLYNKLLANGYSNIDFVGSNTQPWDSSNPPELLFDQNHEGHSGERADEIAASAALWMSQSPADIVLLHAGTNDIEQGQGVDNALGDIVNIINQLRSINPNVKILLAQIVPQFPPGSASTSDIDSFNAQLPGLAAALNSSQSPIVIVDQHSGITQSDMNDDGVHPKASGDSKMADNWYAALTQFLQ